MTNTNEKGLLLSIADGSETAFRELYHTYGRLMFPFLVKFTGSSDMADEIIQETFLRVWLYRDKLPDVEYPRAWIFQIASNQASTWLKKALKAESALQGHQESLAAAVDPGEELAFNEIKRMVQRAIDDLPPQRRLIWQLHREQGLKASEIAEKLGISNSTVKNTLLSAAKAIREKIAQSGYFLSLLLWVLK